MIRIILKESAAKISKFDYGVKHIRFLEKIRDLRNAVERAADIHQKAGAADGETGLWLEIINQIKPLRTEHIKKAVGFGARGGAFLLTNGNILKVGREYDDESGNNALNIPSKLTKSQFGGKGSPGELHVYDSGIFSIEGSEYNWSWREVPRYIPFIEWAADNLRVASWEGLWSIGDIAYDVVNILAMYSKQIKRIPNFNIVFEYFIKTYGYSYSLLNALGPEGSYKLIKAIYDVNIKRSNVEDSRFGRLDLHSQNLGVDQHGNFVFFDF